MGYGSCSKDCRIDEEGFSVGKDYIRFYFLNNPVEKVESLYNTLKQKGFNVFIDDYDTIIINQ